jgi:protein TonB
MEGNMFRDTLLESSPAGRKSKRWPMATAFAVEVAVAGLLIILPLLSSGILPVSAHPPLIAPLSDIPIARHNPTENHPPSGGPHFHAAGHVVTFDNTRPNMCVIVTNCTEAKPDDEETNPQPWDSAIGNNGPSRDFNASPVVEKPILGKRPVVSELKMGQLTHRVEPVYPKMAIVTRVEGQVQLHAVVAKDGSIRTLEVIHGHPLLARAAVDAVKQWRYQPYKLNGEPVEVETFITVNFTATGN